jgi:DNA recombination protein RmuC
MQTTILYIILGVFVIGFIALAFLMLRRKEGSQGMLLLQNQLSEMTKTLDNKLGESRQEMSQAVRAQFSESQKLLQEINNQMRQSLLEVTKEQTKTNEATRQFVTIAEQLSNLEKVLKHQKQRGNLGERSLELILSNMLPPDGFEMQHRFKNGETVDAVIFTKEGIVPVDAKFSLDNYNRVLNAISDEQKEELEKEFKNDLKKRIDETAKYIRADEGTLPFAFMFIPAEAIFYDLLVNEVGAVKVNTRNLIDYALNEKKVCIVSPTTFSAYLQSILYGFKAFRIEKQATDIIKKVDDLGKHLRVYQDFMLKLGNSLGTTINHYNSASKEFEKIDKDVTKISGNTIDVDLPKLEK